MKDQVAALEEAGIPAAFLNSSLDGEAFRRVCGDPPGAYKLLYVAPERLLSEGFAAMMGEQPIAQVAVDEAHCISQWGQDFRPSYLKIRDFLAYLPQRPVVSPSPPPPRREVQEDILTQLGLQDPVKVVTGLDRPNLFFDVRLPEKKQPPPPLPGGGPAGEERHRLLRHRAGVEKVCDLLCQQGIPATRYHAGLSEAERRQNQDDFQYDRKTVMVATNAFGMGIDKSNVGFVIHYNMPKSLEAYYQEAYRAYWDGERMECILLYGQGDVTTAQFFLQQAGGESRGPHPRAGGPGPVPGSAAAGGHGGLLQDQGLPPGKAAGLLWPGPSCRLRPLRQLPGEFVTEDITRQAQIVLSCIQRIHRKLGYHVGGELAHQGPSRQPGPAGALPGAGQPVHLWPAEGGIGGSDPPVPGGLGGGGVPPHRDGAQHLRFTERTGRSFQGATVTMTHRKTEPLPAKGKAPKPAKAPQADEALLDRLKKVRVRVARRRLPFTWFSPTPPWQTWPAA